MSKYCFEKNTLEFMGVDHSEMESMLKQAIRDMEIALESHAQWSKKRFQNELKTKGERSLVGSVSLQRRWVKKYKNVLRILYSLKVEAKLSTPKEGKGGRNE